MAMELVSKKNSIYVRLVQFDSYTPAITVYRALRVFREDLRIEITGTSKQCTSYEPAAGRLNQRAYTE